MKRTAIIACLARRALLLLGVAASVHAWALPATPLAFFFNNPEDDREEAIEDAGEWSASDLSRIDRPGFSLQYPKDWTLATDQPDYDPDRLFTIETPGGSHIAIEIFTPRSGTDLEELLASMVSALDGTAVETYSYGDFDTWGPYQGEGQHLKGKVMLMIPGGCRLFVAIIPGKNKGLLITEFYMADDLSEAMPGFDVISRTLVFK